MDWAERMREDLMDTDKMGMKKTCHQMFYPTGNISE
jgi:hypothetical protein